MLMVLSHMFAISHAFNECDIVTTFRGKRKTSARQTWQIPVFDDETEVFGQLNNKPALFSEAYISSGLVFF